MLFRSLVGRSGSGKSTITRLLQGINREYEGQIKIDGVDLREINLAHLRRSFGVVLQENFLFRGTVRDNISIALQEQVLFGTSVRENIRFAVPAASDEQVRAAARVAGTGAGRAGGVHRGMGIRGASGSGCRDPPASRDDRTRRHDRRDRDRGGPGARVFELLCREVAGQAVRADSPAEHRSRADARTASASPRSAIADSTIRAPRKYPDRSGMTYRCTVRASSLMPPER